MTGAAGFIGSHVVRELLDRGVHVTALLRPSSPRDRIADVIDDVRVLEGDLDAVPSLDDIEVCLHLAWYAEPGAYLHDAERNARSLYDSRRLLDEAQACRRFVAAGTCFEQPDLPESIASTPYVGAKRGFHEVLASARGPSTLCAHIHYLYGPWEDPRRLVASVISSLLAGDRIAVTDGEQVREYLHVRDVARALCDLAEGDITGSVDVCAGDPRRLREVLETIGRITGRGELIGYGERPRPSGEAERIVGDARPLRAIGWEPSMSLEEGIADTVAWWRQRAR